MVCIYKDNTSLFCSKSNVLLLVYVIYSFHGIQYAVVVHNASSTVHAVIVAMHTPCLCAVSFVSFSTSVSMGF